MPLFTRSLREYENHWLLHLALKEAYEEGLLLREIGLDTERGSKWTHRTDDLFNAALPKLYASMFDHGLRRGFKPTPDKPAGYEIDYEKSLEGALGQLENVMRRVDSKESIALLPDFNGREWVSEW